MGVGGEGGSDGGVSEKLLDQFRVYTFTEQQRCAGVTEVVEPYVSRLGFRGQPSEESVLSWVSRHGLLGREGGPQLEEPSERWGEPPTEDEIAQRPATLQEFREEVRTIRQLLSLWTDVRSRDGAAVLESFVDPPTLWSDTPPSWVDRFYDRYRVAFGKMFPLLSLAVLLVRGTVCQQPFHSFAGEGFGKVVALSQVALQVLEYRSLVGGFHALRNRYYAQGVRQAYRP